MVRKQEMHTSFLSSILPLEEGVALGFDVLVRLIALVDNGELCFALRIGDPTDWFKEVNWDFIGSSEEICLEFDLTSLGVVNVWLLIIPFREGNDGLNGGECWVLSKWSIGS